MKEIPVIIFTASQSVEERLEQIQDPRLGILKKTNLVHRVPGRDRVVSL
jgi:hypothetical protein